MATPEERAGVHPAETPLTPTGRVILGMIALGRQTGYDIKQLVDKSTRHFWAASYGQIYPELRRLQDQGLIEGREEPSGARARTVYVLTDAGRAALRGWLASDDELTYEIRDEGMLKLFFSDVEPELRLENIRAMRALYERQLAQLRAVEAHAAGMPAGPGLTLQFGLELTQASVAWCQAAERRLAEGDGNQLAGKDEKQTAGNGDNQTETQTETEV
jgi:PadR family transcriptional regulator, regulatory protein AphA